MTTFKNYLSSKGYSNQTATSYERGLLQYTVWADAQQIEIEQSTYNELLSYVQYLKNKGLQQRSIQQTINSLKHYYKWLIQRQVRKDNPTTNINIKGIKRRKLHQVLSKQDLEKLQSDYKKTYDTNKAQKRDQLILSLLIYQGLNTTELTRLTVQDLKLREGKLYIAGTRRSNERILALESHQIMDMMEYTLQVRPTLLEESKKTTEQLFISCGRGQELHNVLKKIIHRLKKLNHNVENIHQIRTSVIVHWLKHYNLREVQYKAGHRYVSSTEAYLINDLDDLQEDINKYHPIIG